MDGKTDYINCSVQYPNWWYLRRVKDNNPIFSDWAILFIDPIVATIETTQFCKVNAATRYGAYICKGAEAFRELFSANVGRQNRTKDMLQNAPTDDQEKQWSELPEVSNIAIWKCEAERYAQYDYDQIWNECVLETIDYLKIAKEALNQGILDLGHDTLQKLGCYNSRINGAGNVSAVISIYLFSKYADDPVMAVYETANLNNADTDTLASMVGGLVGALNGKDWIPIELRGVQDYSLFEYLIEQMMDEKCDFLNSDKQYQLFNNEKMATLEIGDSIECLPFGEITLKEIREDKPKRAGMYVKVYVWKTAYGQTIFSKKIGKKTLNMEQTIPHTVEKKHSPEIQFTVQKLKDIKKLLIKVSDAADFVEILSEIVQMKIDDDISKEKIDEMKVKWKPYKITKKQIVSIYELL